MTRISLPPKGRLFAGVHGMPAGRNSSCSAPIASALASFRKSLHSEPNLLHNFSVRLIPPFSFSGAISWLNACIANQGFSFPEHRGNDLLPARCCRHLVCLFPGSNSRPNGRETKLHGHRAGSGGRLQHSFREDQGMRAGGHYYRATADRECKARGNDRALLLKMQPSLACPRY